jgi:hypothetical protein
MAASLFFPRARKSIRCGIIRIGHFLFGYRDYLFPVTFLVLLTTTRPALPFGSDRLDWWMDECGAAVALSGQILRALVVGLTDI